MLLDINSKIPPGWKGGFAESKPEFAYPAPTKENPDPSPDLSSLPILDNMANIDRITRGLDIFWPEFSWQTEMGNEKSRCFQMFAPHISNVGYDDTGRIWSIICPQQGFCIKEEICLNVEITVTGQRGWVNEDNGQLAADMQVEAKIWFSPCSIHHPIITRAINIYSNIENWRHFPWSKANAIQVKTHLPGDANKPSFPIMNGLSKRFEAPGFARHDDKSWTQGHIEVQIGDIIPKNNDRVDDFNEKVLDLFNHATRNMLLPGNILTWNLWFLAPAIVDRQKWKDHAQKWRDSIDADHGPKSGKVYNFDHHELEPPYEKLTEKMDNIVKTAEEHLPHWPRWAHL